MKLNNQIKTIVLLGGLSALLVGIGGVLGPGFLYGFTALALLLNLAAYFFSDRIVLRLHQAREATESEAPGLHRMVEELAMLAGIPKPRVFLIPEAQPNAFATGRNPRTGVVAVTEGIRRILTPRELRGVLAHEIAHIKNRDILVSTIAAALAAAIGYIANTLSFASMFGSSNDEEEHGGGNALFLAIVAPLVATLIQLGVSRSREYLADETGARICGDPEALASALRRLEQAAGMLPAQAEPATASLFIVNPLAGTSGITRLFSTHPPVEDRVQRLLAMAPGVRLKIAA